MAIHYECFVALLIRFRQDHAVARRDRGAGRTIINSFARELDLLDPPFRAEGRQGEGVWAGFGRCIAAGYEEAQHLCSARGVLLLGCAAVGGEEKLAVRELVNK